MLVGLAIADRIAASRVELSALSERLFVETVKAKLFWPLELSECAVVAAGWAGPIE